MASLTKASNIKRSRTDAGQPCQYRPAFLPGRRSRSPANTWQTTAIPIVVTVAPAPADQGLRPSPWRFAVRVLRDLPTGTYIGASNPSAAGACAASSPNRSMNTSRSCPVCSPFKERIAHPIFLGDPTSTTPTTTLRHWSRKPNSLQEFSKTSQDYGVQSFFAKIFEV